MSEQGNTLSYALTPNLGRSAKSVAVKRYSAQMKSMGTFGDAELQEALASSKRVRGKGKREKGRGKREENGAGNFRRTPCVPL